MRLSLNYERGNFQRFDRIVSGRSPASAGEYPRIPTSYKTLYGSY